MFKKFKMVWLVVLTGGLFLLIDLMLSGRKSGSMSDLIFCFGLEVTVVFGLIIVEIVADREIDYKFFNAVLLISFFIGVLAFLFGWSKDLSLFVIANLVIFIFYLFFRNRQLNIELRKSRRQHIGRA